MIVQAPARRRRRRGKAIILGNQGNARGLCAADARGLYRVFNAAGYRFYRSTAPAPPPLSAADGGTPYATHATLPYQPAATFADGTWYISMSYFDGVLDSGFLPLGAHGETWLVLTVAGGLLLPIPPSVPIKAQLQAAGGGVVRVLAYYAAGPDAVAAGGGGPATQWAIAYTTDGSTPATSTPTITPAISAGSGLALLNHALPAQAGDTTVKVQLQVRRPDGLGGWIYSAAAPVLSILAVTAGPSAPLSIADGD